jgi:putative hydrolase
MLKVDLHIHTLASGHAYNTILEYINRANDLGMTMIGISDHGESVLGTWTNAYYFNELRRLPRQVGGVTILRGIEANILESGELDITEKVAANLDYVMAGVHNHLHYTDLGSEANTMPVIKAIESGRIKILTHPYLTNRVPFNVRAVAEAACRHKVLLELNISTFEFKFDVATIENLQVMLEVVKRHGQKIIINSDSHSIWQLADETPLKALDGLVDLPSTMIINNYPEELLEFLNIQL